MKLGHILMLKHLYKFLIVCIAASHFFSIYAQKAVTTKLSENTLKPFFKEHCIHCHGPKKQKGKVRLDNLAYTIQDEHQAELWQEVLNVMNFSEMPPEDEPQPETEQFANVLSSLSESIFEARKRMTENGGEVVMRKLNQREYANTIKDIFGFRVPYDMIPANDDIESYDTIGSQQFFSDDHFNKYFKLAKQVVELGFQWAGTPHAAVRNIESHPEKHYFKTVNKQLADLEDKWSRYKSGANFQELGLIDTQDFKFFKERTEKYIKIRKDYINLPKSDQGNYLAFNQTPESVHINLRVDPRADYTFKINGGLLGDAPITRQYAKVNVNGTTIAYPRIKGSVEEPDVTSFTYFSDISKPTVQFSVWENRPRDNLQPKTYKRHIDPEGGRERIWIDSLEIEGPFYRERSFFETLTFPNLPTKKNQKLPLEEKDVKNFIVKFTTRAFREKVAEKDYVDKLYQHYQHQRRSGLSIQKALIEPLAIALVSPQFMYLYEAQNPKTERKLTQRELAIRLSYFLWSSPPDRELYNLASQNKLNQASVLNAQVERMLKDTKSNAFKTNFISQWSKLERFDHLTIPHKNPKYLKFNDGMKHFARLEPIHFFEQLLSENQKASNFIDSDFVMVNHLLASHYGIPNVESDEFVKVGLEQNSIRGGWLTQTAFLSSGTSGERSSPIIRGALVLEKILNRHLPPPPPDVPELGAASKTPLGVRKSVELHKEQAQCSSCHSKMDPLGFGLENFDVMGLWRDKELVAKKNQVIHAHGKLPNGEPFKNIQEMKKQLLKHENLLAQSLLEGMLSYGLGREIEFSDGHQISLLLQKLEPEEYRLKSMVKHLVTSSLFSRK